MRTLVGVILIGILLWPAAGCARRDRAISTKPSADEIPRLEELGQKTQQASVYVEGQGRQPRLQLLPSFEEPELTPEERVALGYEESPYKPLLYYDAVRSPDSILGNWSAGVETYAWGRGGAQWFQDRDTYISWVSSDFESMEVGYNWPAPQTGGVYGAKSPAGMVGPSEAGAAIAIDRASEIATHENRQDD